MTAMLLWRPGGGVVSVSARCVYMGGTRGLGFVSTVDDVLEMSVVCGVRGVGGVCEMCMCLGCGSVGGVGVGRGCRLSPGSLLCLWVL